jgi:hypothetical protein
MWPHSHIGGAGRCQEGGIGLKGGGELLAKPAGAQGKGELGDHRVRLHVSGRRVLNQGEGGEKHPPFGGSDLGGEPRPRSDAGEMGQANLQGGAEREELALLAQGKGSEGSDQAGVGLGPGASVGLHKRIRAEGRAGSHEPLWGDGQYPGRRQRPSNNGKIQRGTKSRGRRAEAKRKRTHTTRDTPTWVYDNTRAFMLHDNFQHGAVFFSRLCCHRLPFRTFVKRILAVSSRPRSQCSAAHKNDVHHEASAILDDQVLLLRRQEPRRRPCLRSPLPDRLWAPVHAFVLVALVLGHPLVGQCSADTSKTNLLGLPCASSLTAWTRTQGLQQDCGLPSQSRC